MNSNDNGLFLFVFNFNPTQSFTEYGIPLGSGKYQIVLNTDSGRFGGHDLVDENIPYYTLPSGGITSQHYLKMYFDSSNNLTTQFSDQSLSSVFPLFELTSNLKPTVFSQKNNFKQNMLFLCIFLQQCEGIKMR